MVALHYERPFSVSAISLLQIHDLKHTSIYSTYRYTQNLGFVNCILVGILVNCTISPPCADILTEEKDRGHTPKAVCAALKT